MKQTRIILLLMISTFAIFACKKDETNDDKKEETPAVIQLLTKEVENITNKSAESGVTIQVSGTGNIEEVGICWSINTSPTINDFSASGSQTSAIYTDSSNTYELNILNLDSNTSYFVRAYAKYKDSVYYGNEQTFTTKSSAVIEDQFWTLGSTINTTSFYSNYEIDEARVVLIDNSSELFVCNIKFGNSLQAPYDYIIKNEGEELLTLETSIEVKSATKTWHSVEGDSKIKTSFEDGKIKVEFVDIEIKDIDDNSIHAMSALFYISL